MVNEEKKKLSTKEFTVTPRISDNRNECLGDTRRKILEAGTSDRAPDKRTSPKITLEDFEIRYKNILVSDPKRKCCSSSGCNNPVDYTMLGEDTSCAYHRLLFDFWSCEVMDMDKFHHYLESQKGRRRAFTNW